MFPFIHHCYYDNNDDDGKFCNGSSKSNLMMIITINIFNIIIKSKSNQIYIKKFKQTNNNNNINITCLFLLLLIELHRSKERNASVYRWIKSLTMNLYYFSFQRCYCSIKKKKCTSSLLFFNSMMLIKNLRSFDNLEFICIK